MRILNKSKKFTILLSLIFAGCVSRTLDRACGLCKVVHKDNSDHTFCAMEAIAQVIPIYENNTGKKALKIEDAGQYYYSTLTGKGRPKDSWGEFLRYDHKKRLLISLGEDGIINTTDDIIVKVSES